MERIKSLGRYSKALLLALVAMAVAFSAVYAVTISRVGYLYKDKILIPSTENGNTIYAAEVQGGSNGASP